VTDALRTRLEAAADGLLFSSESDQPFRFIRLNGVTTPLGALTPDDVAALVGASGARAREVTLDQLLAPHLVRVDPMDVRSRALIPSYEALAAAIREAFPAVRVFRMGEIEIRCLVLGNDPLSGELAGLETLAIET
jgi:hypothetical protein